MDRREIMILLNLTESAGSVRLQKFQEYFQDLTLLPNLKVEDFVKVEGIGLKLAQKIVDTLRRSDLLEQELNRCQKLGIAVLTQQEETFPQIFRELPGAPAVLYCKGDQTLMEAASLAIVGARRCSPYGQRVARSLARECAELGIVTVSGLARGIDTVAHQSTIEHGGRTVAVLGTGLADIYPPENKKLADQVAETGLLLSEFHLDMFPDPGNFPRRNRIVAGMSLGTIVVEAQERSGALITARLAAEQGRDIFAVPGPIESKMSQGPHRLLRDGAKLVETLQDVIEEIAPLAQHFMRLSQDEKKRAGAKLKKAAAALNVQDQIVYDLIGSELVSVETLLPGSHLTPGEFAQVVLSLEMKGLIKSYPGKRYARS